MACATQSPLFHSSLRRISLPKKYQKRLAIVEQIYRSSGEPGASQFLCIFNGKMKFGRGAGWAVRMTHGVRRRGRAELRLSPI